MGCMQDARTVGNGERAECSRGPRPASIYKPLPNRQRKTSISPYHVAKGKQSIIRNHTFTRAASTNATKPCLLRAFDSNDALY